MTFIAWSIYFSQYNDFYKWIKWFYQFHSFGLDRLSSILMTNVWALSKSKWRRSEVEKTNIPDEIIQISRLVGTQWFGDPIFIYTEKYSSLCILFRPLSIKPSIETHFILMASPLLFSVLLDYFFLFVCSELSWRVHMLEWKSFT